MNSWNRNNRSLSPECPSLYFQSQQTQESNNHRISRSRTNTKDSLAMDTKNPTTSTTGKSPNPLPTFPSTSLSPRRRKNTKTHRKWELHDQDIPVFPVLYPLDRTHMEIHLESNRGGSRILTVPSICNRITESMKEQNIAGQWDTKHPNLIQCDSEKLLVFEISLWKKANEKELAKLKNHDDNETDSIVSNTIIIEIHRFSGDVLEFHQVKSNLWNAIHETTSAPGMKKSRSMSPGQQSRPLPRLPVMKERKNPFKKTTFDMSSMNETLVTVNDLFQSGGLFNKKMALEMLIYSTDTNVTKNAYATYLSKVIVLGLNPYGTYLREQIRAEILNFQVLQSSAHYNDDDDDDDMMTATTNFLHQQALQVLVNVFQLISEHRQLSQFKISTEMNEFWSVIIPRLIVDIDEAVTRPHIANAATRCLTKSCNLSGLISCNGGAVDKEKILSAVERAWCYGKENYASLEEESMNLKRTLKSIS